MNQQDLQRFAAESVHDQASADCFCRHGEETTTEPARRRSIDADLLNCSAASVNLWRDPKARLVLWANFLLVVGAGITFMAIPWLLIQRPNGPSLFGYSNAAITLAIFLLLPYLGKLVDRSSRKAIILGFFLFNMATNIVVISSLLIHGRVELWHLLTVYTLGSLGHSVYYPAQFAFNQEVLSRSQYEALSGAIEVQWQAGAMVAGALGAVLINRVPLWSILVIDGLAYLAGFVLVGMIPYQRRSTRRAEGSLVASPPIEVSAWKMMLEGVDYLRQRPRLAIVVFASFLPFLGLMISNYLAPIFVKQTLGSGPEIYGIGEACYAFGAILAGLTVPAINSRLGLVTTLLFTVGVFTLAGAIVPAFPLILVFLFAYFLQGWGNAGSRVARSILVLETVPNDLVGRLNLFYSALERLLRAGFLTLAAYQVTNNGPRSSYWLIVGISLVGWIAIFMCRGVRTFPVTAKTSSDQAA
jgi:MFS family permease